MKTDVIVVSSRGDRMETALSQAEKVAAYKGMSVKDTLHLRLLTEEMMCMMRSLTGETEGLFWIEDENDVYQLHLKVETIMDSEKRDQLLSVSSSGRNSSARGIMGRIRDFFDRGADADLNSPLLLPSMYEHNSSTVILDWEWSMREYEAMLSNQKNDSDPRIREAWDELEKSVVNHVADDIKVFIRGRLVEMVITKKMAG